MKFKSIAEIRKEFDEHLDETEDWVVICGHEFSPSEIMSTGTSLYFQRIYEEELGKWLSSRYEYVENQGYREIKI